MTTEDHERATELGTSLLAVLDEWAANTEETRRLQREIDERSDRMAVLNGRRYDLDLEYNRILHPWPPRDGVRCNEVGKPKLKVTPPATTSQPGLDPVASP